MSRADAAGPFTFARFAYPPNALGYCGPSDSAALLEAGAGSTDRATVSALAARFEGAWPYLELIAACNRIADPLDERVVEAYWIGSPLLWRVPPDALVSHLESRFGRRAGHDFTGVAEAAILGGAAHHSFHVFAVYPWLGLLRAGVEGAPLTVLDQCRIRWGRVISVDGDSVTVRDRGLALAGHSLVEGRVRTGQVRRAVDGLGLAGEVVPGDVVALHWDWVCQRLTSTALYRLQSWTRRMLDVVNTQPSPGCRRPNDPRSGLQSPALYRERGVTG
jgi:hypothetical protein